MVGHCGSARRVCGGMGYIVGLIIILLIVPLLFMLLTRRTKGTGGIDSSNHGVTHEQPSAEEPTPRPGPGVDPRIPPS